MPPTRTDESSPLPNQLRHLWQEWTSHVESTLSLHRSSVFTSTYPKLDRHIEGKRTINEREKKKEKRKEGGLAQRRYKYRIISISYYHQLSKSEDSRRTEKCLAACSPRICGIRPCWWDERSYRQNGLWCPALQLMVIEIVWSQVQLDGNVSSRAESKNVETKEPPYRIIQKPRKNSESVFCTQQP